VVSRCVRSGRTVRRIHTCWCGVSVRSLFSASRRNVFFFENVRAPPFATVRSRSCHPRRREPVDPASRLTVHYYLLFVPGRFPVTSLNTFAHRFVTRVPTTGTQSPQTRRLVTRRRLVPWTGFLLPPSPYQPTNRPRLYAPVRRFIPGLESKYRGIFEHVHHRIHHQTLVDRRRYSVGTVGRR